MATKNLRQCETALQQLGVTNYKLDMAKNQTQVLWVYFNGKKYHANTTYTIQQFLDLFNNNITTSVATSKFNNVNEDEEIKEFQKWLDRQATYAKKCFYEYDEHTLNEIIMYTIEDFGISQKRLMEYHKNWNTDNGWLAKITDNLIYRNGIYTPKACLFQTIKQWLSVHGMYEHDDLQIENIISKIVRV